MLETVVNALKVKEIRSKIIFTLLILLLVRFGSYIPVPGVNPEILSKVFSNNGILSIIDTFSGGSLSRFTIFALSITPYINASIIMTLLTAAFEKLKEISKDDQNKIKQWTRYMTVMLALVQAVGITIFINSYNAFLVPSAYTWIVSIATLTAGTMLLMWLGEQINERGIGNGISLIIFIGIIAKIPSSISTVLGTFVGTGDVFYKDLQFYLSILLPITLLLAVVGIIIVTQGERKVPIHYAKKVVGRKIYGGQSSFIPMKLNQAGVIPIIFASSILVLPGTIISMFFSGSNVATFFQKWLGVNTPIYTLFYILFIIAFTFFYSIIAFNINDVADNLKKNGGFIPGIRPGKPTAEAFGKILNRITLFGAFFLALVAVIPNILGGLVGGASLQFGGTSLLIAVGVALDTMKQMESQLLIRHYQGFMK
ncbi:MAG: preprotein translocase subunit SecY [Fusobacteria bacterium]|nr:MAG: preprotein translocase subunit SecY [Fusobacteriota bacterium]KAF0228066.1 MAG: preprotein translocase subunit [Fusobacteriota bacterium]